MDVIVGKVRDHLEDIRTKNTRSDPNILSELDSTRCRCLSTNDAVDIVARIASILPDLQQDATKLADLAERIAENAPITLEDILPVVSSDTIQSGLEVGLPGSINHVSLALLRTAKSETEISVVASKEKLVRSLVNLWLRTDKFDVAGDAWRVVAHLLGADIDHPEKNQVTVLRTIDTSSHLMWRRLVTDQDTYDLLFSLTSLSTLGQAGQLDRKAKEASQYRLIDFVTTFWPVKSLWTSPLPEISKLYGIKADEGLLHYCFLHMVDVEEDILERAHLLQSYINFLKSSSKIDLLTGSWPNLDFLVQHGIHAEMLSRFTCPVQNDSWQGLIRTFIVEYLQTYVSCYPRHFVEDTTRTKHRILERIWTVLRSTSRNEWARNCDPTGLLELFSSLPRETIFSTVSATNPILYLPLRPFNREIIYSLATIFSGVHSERDTETSTAQVEGAAASAAAARCLFLIYLGANPTFFEDMIAKARSVAEPRVANAALDMLFSLATASWNQKERLAPNTSSSIPGEESLRAQCTFYGRHPLPRDGVSALLLPPAVNHIIPFLLSSSRHLTGDAYSVAQRKYDVVVAVLRKLELLLARGGEEEQDALGLVAEALRMKVRKGILGQGVGVSTTGTEDVTHSVATMSR